MTIKWIDDPSFECSGKTVFCRVDFNVPLDNNCKVIDDSRIIAVLPTINLLIKKGAKLILASHLGRPQGKINSTYSLKPIAIHLRKLLDYDIIFVENCIGHGVRKLIKDLQYNNILMLENTRFHLGEEKNDKNFSRIISKEIDIYVNDAFGSIHREHSSTIGMIPFINNYAAGLLIKKEIEALNLIKIRPKRPFILILGGSKVSDKICLLTSFLNKVDKIIIGGAISFIFLKVLNKNIVSSNIEKSKLLLAENILKKAEKNNVKIILPIDHVVANDFTNNSKCMIVNNEQFIGNKIGLDIGPKSIDLFKDALGDIGTVFWNGPMGVFEFDNFLKGTSEIAKAVANFNGFSVVGGGDSLSAINKFGLKNKFSHVSTGGGASIKFLNGIRLPALEFLDFYR